MYAKMIKYKNFNGQEVEREFYFHISEPELVEMEVEHKDGLGKRIENIIQCKDWKELIKMFKGLILDAYGEKSEDGEEFVKNEELKIKFMQSRAYAVFFMELSTSAESAAEFINGILPEEWAKRVDAKALEDAAKAAGTPSFT